MPVGDQREKFPIEEETVLGVNLVDSSLGKVWSTNVETHGEAFNDDGSNLQGLSRCSDRES